MTSLAVVVGGVDVLGSIVAVEGREVSCRDRNGEERGMSVHRDAVIAVDDVVVGECDVYSSDIKAVRL